MCQPRVSVVMACYNKSGEIGLMLESIRNQIWCNVELIIVNDGSTDNTCDVVAQWIPALEARGYDVILIDQENQGIGAAIKTGMLRMTGDFFCALDADDWLYPDFLWTMATWLANNPDCDYATCGFERIFGTKENWEIKRSKEINPEQIPVEKRIEYYLLYRMEVTVWNYLFRVNYLRTINFVENFVESRITQEPAIAIPAFAGKGKIKHFSQVLLRHFLFYNESTRNKKWRPEHYESRAQLYRGIIERCYGNDQRALRKLLAIWELSRIRMAYNWSQRFKDQEREKIRYAQDAADFANKYIYPSPQLSMPDVLKCEFGSFLSLIENIILELETKPVKSELESLSAKRVIYYGSLNRNANQTVPLLMETRLRPDILWDAAANSTSSICGQRVFAPDLSVLSEDDVLVFLVSERTRERIMPVFQGINTANIITNEQINQYIGECHLPGIYGSECRFVY